MRAARRLAAGAAWSFVASAGWSFAVGAAPAMEAVPSRSASDRGGAPARDEPELDATLQSADTAIRVIAGERAPHLESLHHGSRVWRNRAAEPPPANAYSDGTVQPLEWRLDRAATRRDRDRVEFVYRTRATPLVLHWIWQRRGEGPFEHSVVIENPGDAPVELAPPAGLRFDWVIDGREPLERFWIEKGADTPSAQGTHLDALREGSTWEGRSSTYARPLPGRPREMIPYVLVSSPSGERNGFYVGIEFSGRTHITLARRGDSLQGEAGLDPEPAPSRTRIAPRSEYRGPTVFLGAAAGGADAAGNRLKRWVREVLETPRSRDDAAFPPLVNNSWGSGMAVDEPLARRMIVASAALGLEMFHLDAGWFRDVGDWQPDPGKFPNGIAAVADFAHQHGMGFGLWVDWTQAGTSSRPGSRNVHDPAVRDLLIADPPPEWRHTEPFKGITMDLGAPAVEAWASEELERMVSEYHLDMLEHDGYLVAQGSTRAGHRAVPPDPRSLRVHEDSGYVWVDSSNATDVSFQATRAYYRIYEALRARHPRLLLEICNDGGRMMDFGTAAHGDYFSITDTYDPLSNRRAFHDASFVLPPAMLESYVEKWPTPRIENLRYLLRSGMQGWFSLMMDIGAWSEEQRRAAREELTLYKTALRPLIRSADLYHVSARPDGVHWDGIEYWSGADRRGVLYAFRGTDPADSSHRFRLAGLDPAHRYRLRFHDRGTDAVASGGELMSVGVAVTLPLPLSSELIFLEDGS